MILDTMTYSIIIVATVLTFAVLYLYRTGKRNVKNKKVKP